MTNLKEEKNAEGNFFRVQRLVSEWPEPTEDEWFVAALAREYNDRTEAYDRTVCTGPITHGEIRPMNHHELALINRNALKVRREIEDRAMRERGIDRIELIKAIRKHDRR